jgi:hypothetical protein
MTYKRKLQITVPDTSQQYDPLRRYYSRAGFMKPVREDSSLLASETDSGSKVKWSLGGYTENNPDAIKTPTQKQMDDWAAAHKSTLQSETEIRENEYLTRGPDGQVISLPKVLQQLRINTIDILLGMPALYAALGLIRLYDDGGTITPDARLFLQTIRNSADPEGLVFQEINEIPLQAPLDNREDTLRIVVARLNIYIYQSLRPESIQDKFAVYKAIIQQIGAEEIKRIISSIPFAGFTLSSRQRATYQLSQIIEDTPFITRSEIQPFLSLNAGLRNDEGIAQIEPEYVLYNEKYEQAVSGSTVLETTQPNLYLYDLYTSAGIDEEGRRVDGSWQGDPSLSNAMQLKYGTSVTLDGNIEQNQGLLNDTSLSDYLRIYSKELECNLTEEQRSNINQLLQRTIVPATDLGILEKTNEKKNFFPMYIETSFASDALGPVGSIIQSNAVSSTVLDFLSSDEGQNRQYNIKSDYFVGRLFSDPEDDAESSYIASLVNVGDQPLKVMNMYRALAHGTSDEMVQALTITENGLEPLTGVHLSNSQKSNLDRASIGIRSIAQQEMRSYADFLSDLRTQSHSEALGYRLSKFDTDGQKVQEIIFGNNLETREIKYVDTQVKYDKEYRYELSEFRLSVSTEYQMVVFGQEPEQFAKQSDSEKPDTLAPANVFYDIDTIERPVIEVIEVPIYGSFYAGQLTGLEYGISYPQAKVMDHPPAAPDLQVLPLLDNYRQVKLVVQPNTGDYTGDYALPLITLPGSEDRIQSLFNYQKQFENFNLRPGYLEYKNEGVNEIHKVRLLRSRDLDLTVPEYNDLYISFFTSETGEVRTLSTDPDAGEETVVSYDILDDLQINTYYYYSCYVEDVHGNPSLPSPIYRVRLVYEKGLYIPEIELFNYKPMSNKTPTKKFARFIQLAASEIQSFPFTERDENDILKGIKNLASEQGKSVADNSFIFRFTSRDTGRKFDLKINVEEKTITPEDGNIFDCE